MLEDFLTKVNKRFLTLRVLTDEILIEEKAGWYSKTDIKKSKGNGSDSPTKGSQSPRKRRLQGTEEQDPVASQLTERYRGNEPKSNTLAEDTSLNAARP